MEEGHPLMDPFPQKLICKKFLDSKEPKRIKQAEDRRLICTTTAKRNYFLNDEDMRPLRFISKRNPYHPNSPIGLRPFNRSEFILECDLREDRSAETYKNTDVPIRTLS
jgi:hypothetical protein